MLFSSIWAGKRDAGTQPKLYDSACVEKGRLAPQQAQGDGAQAVDDILTGKELVTSKQKAEANSAVWEIPCVDLAAADVDVNELQELLLLVKPEVCRRLKVVPFARTGNRIRVAMQNPLDVFAQDELRALLGKELSLEVVTASEEGILALLNQAAEEPSRDMTQILDRVMTDAVQDPDLILSAQDEDAIDVTVLRERSTEAPVVALSKAIILQAVQSRASDIHIQPFKDHLVVRYRIDGVLRDVMPVPRGLQAALISRMKIMAEMDIANRLVPQDGRIGLVVQGKSYDFRVSTLPGVYGEKVVMRILDKSSAMVGMDKLGFSPETRKHFERMITATYGIILITGPTGSGKSTTLYSVLSQLNAPEKNIVTVEDPVEYQLPGLTQVQANPIAGLTFAVALKAFLRQDPNILMVGEIRDREVGSIAVEAALTGHLVLSTLHTNDAPTAVTRLTEMGIEPFLISSSVIGVLAQRLVRRICEKCREPYVPDREALWRAGFDPEESEHITFYHGR
ncbi:MAG TPA: GspE/PulE family protein, partial [Armatimonadota bacterium]|nr:GspE/PulE family protein [Armatimonadota bacterium]